MNNGNSIIRIDHEDSQSRAAVEAEQRLFAHYGLEYRTRIVDLKEPRLMAQLGGWRMISVNRPGSGLSDGLDLRAVDLRRPAVDTLR